MSDFLERHVGGGGILIGWDIHHDLHVLGFEKAGFFYPTAVPWRAEKKRPSKLDRSTRTHRCDEIPCEVPSFLPWFMLQRGQSLPV